MLVNNAMACSIRLNCMQCKIRGVGDGGLLSGRLILCFHVESLISTGPGGRLLIRLYKDFVEIRSFFVVGTLHVDVVSLHLG